MRSAFAVSSSCWTVEDLGGGEEGKPGGDGKISGVGCMLRNRSMLTGLGAMSSDSLDFVINALEETLLYKIWM